MVAIDKDVPLNDLAVLWIEHMADDSRNRSIDVRHVVAIHPTCVHGKANIVLVKLEGRSSIGDNLSSQIDVEDEPPLHVEERFATAFAADRATSFGNSRGHGKDSRSATPFA